MARKVLVDLDFQSIARATNLAAPSASSDAATKGYVDSAVEGLAWKDNVRVSTQGNINLSSPGATIDGVTLAALDRVLVRNQTTQADNGIYVFNGAAVAMTRALDALTFTGLVNAVTTVNEGTNAGSSWRQTAITGTLGTTPIIWVSFGVTAPPASTVVETRTEGRTCPESRRYCSSAPGVSMSRLDKVGSQWAAAGFTRNTQHSGASAR